MTAGKVTSSLSRKAPAGTVIRADQLFKSGLMKLFLKTPNNITEETLISAKVSRTARYSWEAANETEACHTQTASTNWL